MHHIIQQDFQKNKPKFWVHNELMQLRLGVRLKQMKDSYHHFFFLTQKLLACTENSKYFNI